MHSTISEQRISGSTQLNVRRGLGMNFTRVTTLALIATSLLALDGCAVIKGIFGAGVGVGVIAVVVVLVLAGGIFAMVSRK